MAQRALTKGQLATLRSGRQDVVLTFQYNPTTIRRSRRATYARNQAALADFPNASGNAVPSLEWVRNEAEEFTVDLIFHEDGPRDIETQLKALDDFMVPDANSGQPLDLVLVMGIRSDRVRILEKDVVEKLFKPDLSVQEATVNLKIVALRSRSA